MVEEIIDLLMLTTSLITYGKLTFELVLKRLMSDPGESPIL